jgi:dipeptidyl aminopeptidase/acylaminoacyl peptidase
MLDLGELLRIPCTDIEMGCGLSPDGRKIAFSWNPTGNWEIYELDLFEETLPRLISSGPGGKFQPLFSPDGSSLAYAVDFDGSECFHIFKYDFETQQQTDLTPFAKGSLQASFDWSPDGQQIVFCSDEEGQFDVYVMEVDSNSEPLLVLAAGFPAWKVRWSPDGKWLAVVVEASGIDFGAYIVPAGGGEAIRIMEAGKPIDAGQACWSPDSHKLAFSSDAHGFNNIGIYDLDGGEIDWLTSGDEEKQYPCWSPDGKSLAYILNRGTAAWVALQAPGGEAKLFQVEAGAHYLPMFTLDGWNIVFEFDNPRHPCDLWRLSLKDTKLTQLTYSRPAALKAEEFVMPEEIAYPGMDGVPVPALLFAPPDRNGSAVVIVHGGPDWFFEQTWYPLMAAMASKGWVVLAPNYRGSTGYGRQWQEASRFDFGGVDTDDVAAGALYLAQTGLADPRRIGITGRSHGGYLVASCLTRHPGLWAVGSAVVPFLNWFTNHAEIRPDLQQWDLENFGDPETNHDLWQERSPAFFLDKVDAPLQLICGRLDPRCPISDSVAAYEELRKMNKTADLVIYEDEGHAFLKRENILDSELRRLAFLAQYLEKEP